MRDVKMQSYKGKRSSGYFALETIAGEKVHASANANVKKNNINSKNGENQKFLPSIERGGIEELPKYDEERLELPTLCVAK